jgi:hypothetical protein
MSADNKKIILESYKQKSLKSIDILEASMRRVKHFDSQKEYTYDELEPYDAMADRFVRSVEVLFKYMRSLQIYNEGISSETLRDRLLYSEKLGLITSVDLWIEMREVRNRIVHDYLPDMQKFLFDDIMNTFIPEIRFIIENIKKLNI